MNLLWKKNRYLTLVWWFGFCINNSDVVPTSKCWTFLWGFMCFAHRRQRGQWISCWFNCVEQDATTENSLGNQYVIFTTVNVWGVTEIRYTTASVKQGHYHVLELPLKRGYLSRKSVWIGASVPTRVCCIIWISKLDLLEPGGNDSYHSHSDKSSHISIDFLVLYMSVRMPLC